MAASRPRLWVPRGLEVEPIFPGEHSTDVEIRADIDKEGCAVVVDYDPHRINGTKEWTCQLLVVGMGKVCALSGYRVKDKQDAIDAAREMASGNYLDHFYIRDHDRHERFKVQRRTYDHKAPRKARKASAKQGPMD